VKFKLDENLPVELVTDLRSMGHDADTVIDEGLRRPDTSGRRAVVAFVRERLSEVLEMDLSGRLTVVGPSRIRFR
jgi:hypothetical protein